MRNSIVSWAAAAAIALGVPVVASSAANAESVMRLCATQWKEAQGAGTTGGQTWPQFLAQCRSSQNGAAAAPASAPAPAQSGSLIPWWQPSAPASAPASNASGPTAGQSVMRLCASQWKDAKAAGTTGGQTWPQFLAQCRASRSASASPSGGFAPVRAGPCPSARLSVGLAVSMVAAVGPRAGVERRSFRPASGRVHDRASGASDLPIRPGRVGQHADGRLPLFRNPLLRAHAQGRLYVRSQCAGERISRGEESRT